MECEEIKLRLNVALAQAASMDYYLLENDLSERCIASRVAMYLQDLFQDYSVDVEYNRDAVSPKRLELPPECANYTDKNNESLVVPDVIIHQRGPQGPNLLVLEFKKTSNPQGFHCDYLRLCAFRKRFKYCYGGALVECETRRGREPSIRVTKWLGD